VANSLLVVHLTGRVSSPYRIMPQVLFSPCGYFTKLWLHLPALLTAAVVIGRQVSHQMAQSCTNQCQTSHAGCVLPSNILPTLTNRRTWNTMHYLNVSQFSLQ